MTSPRMSDLRRPSPRTSPRTGLLPSPFSHSDEALAPSRFSATGGPDPPLYPADDDYPDPGQDSLLPPPTFQPFFTMITDAESGESYHPSTYYVFSDDEPDVLSSAALHALDAFSPAAIQEAEARALIEGGAREEERYVLIDLAREGTAVTNAKSLAPSWAVTRVDVRHAPTFDGGEGDGLMLMVEGLSSTQIPATQKSSKERLVTAKASFDAARKKTEGNAIGAMEELARGMIDGLTTLDKIVALD